MELSTATQAGSYASQINELNAYLTNLSALLTAGNTIVNCNTVLNGTFTLIDFAPLALTQAETATIAAAVQSVLNARLTTLNTELAAM